MGVFDAVSNFFGTENEEKAKGFETNPYFNANAQKFGPQGALMYDKQKNEQAAAIDQRGAFQADYAAADQSRGNAMAARAGQAQAAGLMMNRAMGQTPSIAGMQAQQDMQRAVAAQSSAAAGARGPAAMALAQQNAAANTANAQSAISGQAQVNAANERLQAENAAYGAMSGMRGQDVGAQAQDANQAQFQAGMQMQNRAANDQRAMQYAQMGHQAMQQEQQGALQMQGYLAGSQANVNTTNAQVGGQNAGMAAAYLGGTAKLGEAAVGAMSSDARAKYGAQPIGGGGSMLSDVYTKTGLAQLGGPGAISPQTGSASPSFDKLAPGGGMDVMGSLKAHSDFGTRFQRDPTGGNVAGGLMLSDDRAKLRDHERQAYLLGRAHGMERNSDFAYGGAPREGEEIVDRDPWQADSRRAEQRPEWLEGYMHEQGGASARAGLATGLAPMRSEMTGQLARGLAPYAYRYKDGFGTPGEKVGPMAQEMAANDVTATAIRQDPQSGLLGIDRDDGLKVALGGVGHLAQKQAAQEELLRGLLAARDEEPITDANYLAHARRQRRGF